MEVNSKNQAFIVLIEKTLRKIRSCYIGESSTHPDMLEITWEGGILTRFTVSENGVTFIMNGGTWLPEILDADTSYPISMPFSKAFGMFEDLVRRVK